MKKGIIFFLFFLTTFSVFSQDEYFAESTYYKVYSDQSEIYARSLASKLDAYFEFYNQYFHFDVPGLGGRKLIVRIFSTKDSYDRYLEGKVTDVRNSFVYFQYTDPSLNEMVGYSLEDEQLFNIYFSHYTLIQFMRSFIANPPLWLRLGFATYFEKSYYDQIADRVVFRENMDWLPTLKQIISPDIHNQNELMARLLGTLNINMAVATVDMESAYAQSWGLIYFLTNSPNREYKRILWDSLANLNPAASEEDNAYIVVEQGFGWVNMNDFLRDYVNYMQSVKTYDELVGDGLRFYNLEDYTNSTRAFMQAISLNPDNPFPYYYLGLISYELRLFDDAEMNYKIYLQKGGDEGIGYYALGVNADAAGQADRAIGFLERAYQADPSGYGENARQLIERILGTSAFPEQPNPTAYPQL